MHGIVVRNVSSRTINQVCKGEAKTRPAVALAPHSFYHSLRILAQTHSKLVAR